MSKIFTLTPAGTAPHINFSSDLNPEQLAVVSGADGPSLVLAGAGSGKTRTIVYRVACLLQKGIPPEQILLLTFTNRAAREMLSRVEFLLGAFPTHLTGGTFHHVCNMLLRRYATAIGYGNNFSILDQEDSRDLFNACIKDAGIDTKQKRFPSASVLQSFWSYSRNARVPFADVVELKQPRLLDAVNKMDAVVAAYEARKKTANAMDFDDLLVLCTQLLKTNPSVREHVASQYHYVLVDEYQDTNRVQAELLSLLSSVHGNLLVVGDDAQSIYSFRGADIQNILGFPTRFPNANVFKLETNYRSTPPILHLANESIRWNVNQFPKELRAASDDGGKNRSSDFEEHRGALPPGRASVVRPERIGGTTRVPRNGRAVVHDKPTVVAASTAEEEAQFIAEMILKLRDEGTPLSEIAVLFRATFHSQTLEFELTKRDIPYDYRGGIRFFERAHIKDVLSFLRIHVNPADEVSWLRVLRLQTGIGTETASTIVDILRGVKNFSLNDLVSSVDTPCRHSVSTAVGARARAGWKDFTTMVEAMLKAGDAPADCIRAVVKSSYGDYLDNEFPNAEERREDLEQLAVFAEKYESLGGFLAESALHEGFGAERQGGGTDPADGGAGETEKIVLSTIHQAKGLEWDVVFILHLFDGAFPNARAMEEEGGMEEERRLFYVACTRTRKQLFLAYPLVGMGERSYLHQPSQFVRELPEASYERMELRRATPGYGGGALVFKDDDFVEEDTIELDGKGEVKTWKGKSFLREV